ncbi:two-component system sensor histidine kinase NtrB [Thermosulfurimonas marina]|uniref:two-component system sensor histidine kinase NtrB n=1 Tax=Thermosulfurimonas marina TaxID=2047767 RepID=UPI001B3062F4|nr:ATP-binding protein [Thermosulfurimonas marina]
MSLLLMGYFFFAQGPSQLSEEWFSFFMYVGALGLISILALKLSELRAEILHHEDLRRTLLTSLAAGLVFLDPDLRVVSWNPRAKEILPRLEKGRFLPEILGKTLPFRSCRGEARLDNRIIGYSLFPLRRGERTLGWGFLFQDITEAREKEEALAEARRLASLGTMAAGLIHEIRNPLATISGGVEFLRERLAGVEDLAPVLEMMGREAERLNRLVTHFLFFARPERGETEEFAVEDLLEETLSSLGDLFSGIEVRRRVELGRIQANRDQWRQILENLLSNAAEATREAGGRLVEVEILEKSSYYVLRVRDTGPGIPPEVRPKIFDPFFTTKAQGTGLGLAVVYRIVKNLGGEVLAFSEKGQGSLFEVRIPKKERA